MSKISRLLFDLIKYPTYKAEQLFTPSTAASVNYIKRENVDLLLYKEMSTPGKQLVVFGHSGSGKTSSVRNMLDKHKYKYIRTHCESATTFEQLILNAFDELGGFVASEVSHTNSTTIKGELAAEYRSIRSCIAKEQTSEDKISYSRVVPPQLTPQKLARFMGESRIVWLIEDFHKVNQEEKRRIADIVKIFVDNANDYPSSKIICIGACESAHELIQLDSNLSTRVSEISVPLLHDDEIEQIVRNGFRLLNVIPCNSLVEKLVYYSDRLGSAAHQMCLDICLDKRIEKTSCRRRDLEDSSFQAAIDGFINRRSDTLKTIYEAATKDQLGWYILKTFSFKESGRLSLSDITTTVNKNKSGMRFPENNVQAKLQELIEPPFSIIYYNRNAEKYALSTPFWHRFLRLQFNIEAAKKRNTKKNKNNKSLPIDNNLKYQLVDQLMYKYIQELIKEVENS